jgi:hypothetical protein
MWMTLHRNAQDQPTSTNDSKDSRRLVWTMLWFCGHPKTGFIFFEYLPFGPSTSEFFLVVVFELFNSERCSFSRTFLRTRVQKLMKECGEERDRKWCMTVVGWGREDQGGCVLVDHITTYRMTWFSKSSDLIWGNRREYWVSLSDGIFPLWNPNFGRIRSLC